MTKPRYKLRLCVVEIDAEGEERDTFEEYTTERAIDDAQAADGIAFGLIASANLSFALRADHSPVTPHEGG